MTRTLLLLLILLLQQARPSPIILIMYCFYWAVVITFVVIKWRNGSLFDADYKRKRTLLKLGRESDAAERRLNRCVLAPRA